MKPIARHEELMAEPVGQELILYDRRTHRAHRLNQVASLLWRRCDGSRTVEQLAHCLHEELGLPAGDTAAVRLGLERLGAADLVDLGPGSSRWAADFDRRTALRAAAWLLPVVTSILAPTPARAQSLFPPPPPPPPPPNPFEQFIGTYSGNATLKAYTFKGLSMQLAATVEATLDDAGAGEAAIATERVLHRDPPRRNYAVTVTEDGQVTGSGSFLDANGNPTQCTLTGRYDQEGRRMIFTETIVFVGGLAGEATWEIVADR